MNVRRQTIMRPSLLLGISALLFLAGFAGCGKNDNGTNPGDTNPVMSAQVMFVDASPNSPPVDVYIDSVKVISSLAYGSHTAYLNVVSGNHYLIIQLSGTSRVLYAGAAPLIIPTTYSVFGADTLSHFTPIVLLDNFVQPSHGYAAVRFVNAAAGSPEVHMVLNNDSTSFRNISFTNYSTFIPVPADSTVFAVRVPGSSTNLVTVPKMMLGDGSFYSVYLRGFWQGSGAYGLALDVINNR